MTGRSISINEQQNAEELQRAPIALFVYDRLDHTTKTVEALSRNILAGDSELFVFSDGARGKAAWDSVLAVRGYIASISGFKKVHIVERDRNLGLAGSILSGVNQVISRYGKVVVLEDDMVTSPYFLQYMNDALDCYEADDRVISVHGYVYPVGEALPETFFMKGADCWGWATWSRGWSLFEPDGEKLLSCLKAKNLEARFDFNNSYPYLEMLQGQVSGKNDSWAIRWYASALIHDKLTLYPGCSLVRNIGTDESGVHCGKTDVYDADIASRSIRVEKMPVTEEDVAVRAFSKYFRSIRPSLARQILRKFGL